MQFLDPDLRSEFTSIVEKAKSLQPFNWRTVYPLTLEDDTLMDAKNLHPPSSDEISNLLKRVVVLKLNGGLGTSMGCDGPKSLIPVQGSNSFLDLVLEQIEYLNSKYNCDVPLVLMNSFSTHDQTMSALSRSSKSVRVLTCVQSMFPRIDAETWEPIATSIDNSDEFYPPGHGDVFRTLKRSGLIESLSLEGRDVVFLSNIDNLGATLDLSILKAMTADVDFITEQTTKTAADVKGGCIITYNDHVTLLETAQVPPEHMSDFTSISKFPYFNTNNIWFKISAARALMESGELNLDVIINPKKVKGRNVLQLEQAVGSAIGSFKKVRGVVVSRDRFLPVKKTNDLLLIKSNLYIPENGKLVANPQVKWWNFNTIAPTVRLGPNLTSVNDFVKAFPEIPDCSELCHLTISGSVSFASGVKLAGTVIIIVDAGQHMVIDTNLCDVIVTSHERRPWV
ncbi:hypothetical protein RCL1_001774 [Eukaryota sp. TZLM3-RCL]